MIKDYFEVPDVEHDGDIEYFKGIIQDAGGIITGHSWSGDDGDSCYIFSHLWHSVLIRHTT